MGNWIIAANTAMEAATALIAGSVIVIALCYWEELRAAAQQGIAAFFRP